MTDSNCIRSRSPQLAFLFIALFLCACGGRPRGVILEVESLLRGSKTSRRCASADWSLAERKLREARELERRGDSREAEQAARVARRLAQEREAAKVRDGDPCAADPEESTTATEGGVEPGSEVRSEEGSEARSAPSLFLTIYFAFDSPRLDEEALSRLEEALPQLREGEARLDLQGHCDLRGSAEYNLALSLLRAKAVQRYLEQNGVAADRLITSPYGKELPASFLETEAGHRLNRRVEIRPLEAGDTRSE